MHAAPESVAIARLSLVEESMVALSAYFATTEHRPSEDMLFALRDVMEAMAAMATDTSPRRFYLSSLAPGAGKSQAVCAFVRELLKTPMRDAGVIVCVARLSEIKPLAASMGLAASQFTVFTSDASANALGTCAPDSAPVLFTTQQMLDRRCSDGSFEQVDAFGYQGRPRKVRVWDEACLPGVAVTVSFDDISSIAKALRLSYTKFASTLDKLNVTLLSCEDGSTIEVPDFEALHGVELNEVLGAAECGREDLHKAVSDLLALGGRTCAVRKDGAYGHTFLDYKETLPPDLAPVLILDASGIVRTAYSQWENSRGSLMRLKHCHKDYSKLKLRVWRTGGGKSAFTANGAMLAEGVVKTIMSRPGEQWLVVHHKAKSNKYDTVADILNLLPESEHARVHFLPWGQHQATNEFVEVPNVILAGTLFLRPSQYEGIGRLASATPPGTHYGRERIADITLGEHADRILQALCRGAVRRLDGNTCGKCDAYIIASSRSGIPEALPAIFPGASVFEWQPVPIELQAAPARVLAFLSEQFEGGARERITFAEVMKALGMKDGTNFKRDVRENAAFVERCARLGIAEFRKGKLSYGFARRANYAASFADLDQEV